MSYQQQLPGPQSYSNGGERNVYRCVAGAVEQIIPEAVVFPPQEGPTLNVNQAAGTSDSSIRMPAKRLPSQGVPGCCSRGQASTRNVQRRIPVCSLSTATCNPISCHHQKDQVGLKLRPEE